MDADAFARRFADAYGEIYRLAVRRVRDKREQLSPETTAFLLHLAEAGPMTLTELARHMDRAQSTTSGMVDHLVAKAFLARQPDPADARRAMIWLTEAGRARLAEQLSVLDEDHLARAAARLEPDRRQALSALIEDFIRTLKEEQP